MRRAASARASPRCWRARCAATPAAEIPETVFVEASGKAFNTIPPTDSGFYELLNELVQEQPAGSTEIELMGELAAIGIVKGKPFAPDERMRRVLAEAAAVGTATSRALVFDPRASEGFAYYDGSAWENQMWVGGYDFETPPPLVTEDGIKPFPPTGVRALHARTALFYGYTGVSPAMCMRLTGVGSQYIVAFKDADGGRLDGAKSYRVTLPPDIPAARFWSITVYDTETRSMLQTPQRFPRAGSQSYPTPAATANDDGSTTVSSARSDPRTARRATGSRRPGKGWFVILRLYSPRHSFFDKSWRPSEIEPAWATPARELPRQPQRLRGLDPAERPASPVAPKTPWTAPAGSTSTTQAPGNNPHHQPATDHARTSMRQY